MLVIPEIALATLMRQIVESTHSLTDTAGEPQMLSTIPQAQMRMAALVAIQIVAGETVWPGDKQLLIKRPKQTHSIFAEG